MLAFSNALLAFVFFMWLLPLGIFIKPSQEKIACDGQRAVCMCSHTQAKAKANPIEGNGLKSASTAEKESSGGSAGHYYLALHQAVKNVLTKAFFNDAMFLAYRNPSLRSIEHIPKG